MGTLHSALLLCLGLLFSVEGLAAPNAKSSRPREAPTCDSLIKGDFSIDSCRQRVTSKDRLKQKWPSVAKIQETETSALCSSAANASKINNNRCEQAVDELKRLLKEREHAALDRCNDREEQLKACRACSTDLGASNCQQQNISMNDHFRQRGQLGIAKRKELMSAARNVENEMFQLSEDYGKNLSDLKQDLAKKKQSSPAAQDIGAGSISDGLRKHGNANPADIYRVVDQLRNKREVTQSDMQSAQNLQSEYARESLTRALEAKAARLEMEKENDQDSKGISDLERNTSKVARNTSNLNSVDPAASQASVIGGAETNSQMNPSAVAGAGGAAAGAMGGGASSGGEGGGLSTVGANEGGTYDPVNAAKAGPGERLTGVVNGSAGAKGVGIQSVASAERADEQLGSTGATGASRMSVKDALRAKLAEQLAQGQGGSTSASQAAAGTAAAMNDKLREKVGSNPDLLMGFSPAGFSAAGSGNFSMAQSETDAAVKEMMTEFEGEVRGGFGDGVRHLASVAGDHFAPEILAADSSDLFLRTKTFYERCQKRGCVQK